jgi:hypothetical protein
MIVLAVLGLSFAISYATANRGIIQSRNAEEHSEALGIINSQVELLRSAYAAKQDLTNVTTAVPPNTSPPSFCMQTSPVSTAPLPFINVAGVGYTVPTSTQTDDFTKYPTSPANNNCVQYTYYHVSVTYRPAPSPTTQPYFDFIVRWQGLGDLGIQQEELTYRINSITASTASSPYPNPPPGTPPVTSCGFNVGSITGNTVNNVTFYQSTSGPATFVSVGPTLAWGDGQSTPYSGAGSLSHTYAAGGITYTIKTTAIFNINGVPTSINCQEDVSIASGFYSWLADGGAFDNCTNTDSTPVDANSNCNPTTPQSGSPGTNALYARRDVNVTYGLNTNNHPKGTNSIGTRTLTGTISGGPADLVVNFNQYANGNPQTVPGSPYSFNINVTVNYLDGTQLVLNNQQLTPQGSGANTYLPTNAILPLNIPTGEIPISIQLNWTNNLDVNPPDPDLQINRLELLPTIGTPGTLSPVNVTPPTSCAGIDYDCSSSNCTSADYNIDGLCGSAGLYGLFSCRPANFSFANKANSTIPPGSYNLTMIYSNNNCGNGYPPGPTGYSYPITTANDCTTTTGLPITSFSSPPQSISLSQPQNITYEWCNDSWYGPSSPTPPSYYDSNLEIDGVIISPT